MSNIGLWIIIVKVFSLTIAYVYPALLQYRDSSHPRRFLLLVISYYDLAGGIVHRLLVNTIWTRCGSGICLGV